MPDPSLHPEPPARPRSTEAPQRDWRKLHLWQVQPVRDLIIVAVVLLIVYLGYEAKLVTIPLLVALLLAYLFEPLVSRLTRAGHMSRRGAVLGIIAAGLLAVVVPLTLGVGYAAVQGVGYAEKLADQIRTVLRSAEKPEDPALKGLIRGDAWNNIRDWLVARRAHMPAPAGSPPLPGPAADPAPAEPASGDEPPAHDEPSGARLLRSVLSWTEQNAGGIASTVGKTAVGSGAQAIFVVLGLVASIGGLIFTLFLTLFFFYFLSTGWGRVLDHAGRFIPDAGKYRWMRVIRKMDRAIAGFVRGRLTICAIIAAYMTLAFWLIGVPAPLLVGPVVGMIFLIPFASLVAVPFIMLLLWLQSDGVGLHSQWWWIIFMPILCHAGGQVLDDYILTPKIQGDNTDLEVPTILFASLAGGALAGVYGLLLAIPVAACLKILANEFVWPRIEAWVRGQVHDPLPISRG